MRPASPKLFITGINRGLGRTTVQEALRRGYRVFGTVRNEDLRAQVEGDLAREGFGPGQVQVLLLEGLAISQMPAATREALEQADILINNLGTGADLATLSNSMAELDEALLVDAVRVNALSAHQLMQVAVPRMVQRGWGRVVNVSSARSTLGTITGDIMVPAYRLSKLMLNGITVLTAHEHQGSGVLINCLCPGWCQTDMGGPSAPDTPDMGAQRILQLAELPDGGPTGRLFIDDQVVEF